GDRICGRLSHRAGVAVGGTAVGGRVMLPGVAIWLACEVLSGEPGIKRSAPVATAMQRIATIKLPQGLRRLPLCAAIRPRPARVVATGDAPAVQPGYCASCNGSAMYIRALAGASHPGVMQFTAAPRLRPEGASH